MLIVRHVRLVVTLNSNNQNFIKDHTYSIDFGQWASTP